MAVRWLVCLAVFSFLLSAERVADPRLLHEADSFLTRRHGARESEEKRTEAPLAALGVQETSNDTRTDVKVGLPKCSNGSLQLDGVYEVKDQEEVVLVEGPSCRVMGSAQLLLSTPVRFQGDAVFAGQLSVKAVGDGEMQGSCITVKGNLTLQPEAHLSLHGCRNQAEGGSRKDAGNGGCLHVGGDAELRGGHLQLNGCTASKGAGGGIVVGGALQSRTATIDAEGCHAQYGGAIRADSVVISGGHVVIKESSAEYGGAIYAGNMVFSGGNVTIEESKAYDYGGAIKAWNVNVSGGSVIIGKSKADYDGGAISARSSMYVSGGNVTIKESEAYHDGGAIRAGDMVVAGGSVSIKGSAAQENGGAIRAEDMVVAGGSVSINESTAGDSGGAIYARRSMYVSGGSVTIKESGADGSGGAIHAENVNVSRGQVSIKGATARMSGGAIKAWSVNVSGGSVIIGKSKASYDGGAISARSSMYVSGGNVSIKGSAAHENGGCVYTGNFAQSNSGVSLQGCTASGEGGGMYSRGNIAIEGTAMVTIRDSFADKGGCVVASSVNIKAEKLQLSNCSAASHGGCFYLKYAADFDAPLLLRDCKAKGTGGGIYAQGKLVSQQIICRHCHAPTSGVVHLEDGEASIGSLMLHSGSRLVPASPSIVAAGDDAVVTLGKVDCREVPGCTLAVVQMRLARLLCQRGESRQSLADDDGEACRECPTGQIRLVAVDKEDARCTPCPNMGNVTIGCTSAELLVPPGYMVDFDRDVATNLSAWYRCPNEMACRGGHFNASEVAGERAQELVPMCEEGYRGPGCTSCTEGHARADADILWCVPCANWTTSPKQVVWYISFFLLKNLALFVSAVVSVEGSGGKRAASATLLNQAMSFAAVAGVTMSGAMQTSTFKNDLDNAAQVALQMLALPASVAQGQGSSDGGSSSMSGQCLLQLLDMDSSIHHVHLLMSLWPALLVAGLAAWKGGWLAAVVGSNVFLPAFVAGFGKYLVAFRLRPESEDEALHLDVLPPGPQMSSYVPLRIAAVLGAIVGFSALSVCSWIYAVRTRLPEETRPHVAYLIQAYRPECAIWEVERLMRKVVLSLIATVLPVTLSPALQMEAVTLVLIASLVAHLYFWPYQADDWNRAEIGLLIVSLTITGMTTCLIANDLHWAKSTLTQRILVFLICSIAGGICIVMLVTFSLAYLAERRQRAEAKKAEDTSAARPLSPRRESAAEPRADETSTVDD